MATAKTDRKRILKAPGERRQDLLDAAVRVFKAKGIHSTTVADITDAAGVAKGTFYLYFESRDHLLAALRESFVDAFVERTTDFYERVGRDDWWSLVDAMIETMVEMMYERRDAIAVFVQEGFTPATVETFGQCDVRVNQMIASGIQAGIEAGVFEVDDPEAAAALLHHAIEGTGLEGLLYNPELSKERLIAAGKALARKTLAPSST
ncbi:MAG: TetR/AcrR family transcriptional regulator [Actinomycetota bacterium]